MPVNKGVLRDFSVVSKKNVVSVVSGCSMQNRTCLNKYLLHEKADKQMVLTVFYGYVVSVVSILFRI